MLRFSSTIGSGSPGWQRSITISGYFGNALCNAVRARVAIAIRKKPPGYVIILKKENEIFLIHTGGRIPA